MKMYKETLRHLAPIGVLLFVITMIFTVINGGQDCFGQYTLTVASRATALTRSLTYYALSGAAFALYGFSFLLKRSASDMYHSLPVKRLDMYISVTLASASWIGATIVLNTLAMLGILLISGSAFVPAYIPLNILAYFVATMLVYAAFAIGCALSGTLLTAVASGCVILLLPRFVQFIIARGVVFNVPIVGWLDVGGLLDPTTNVATGLIVMHSRDMFTARVIDIRNILYSMLPMLLELGLGALLFIRRPSETAERGSASDGWIVATSCMLSFTALLLITIDNKRLFSVYGGAVVLISLIIFIAYQLIAARSLKAAVRSLPAYVAPVAAALGVMLCISSVSNTLLTATPTPEEIESVTFRGHDNASGGNADYYTILLSDIDFTSENLKVYVSETLTDASMKLQDHNYTPIDENRSNVKIEPVTIKLRNGETLYRTIEFSNLYKLNRLRSEDERFVKAIRAVPPESSIHHTLKNSSYTREEMDEMLLSYFAEAQEKGLITAEYYREQPEKLPPASIASKVGGEQSLMSMTNAGYIGVRRYYDTYTIRLETPKTASLHMQIMNSYAEEDTIERMLETADFFVTPMTVEDDSFSLNLTFYNVPLDESKLYQVSVGYYLSGYDKLNSARGMEQALMAQKFAKAISLGKPTADSSRMFVKLNWGRYLSTDDSTRFFRDNPVYLEFDEAGEQAIMELLKEYQESQQSPSYG